MKIEKGVMVMKDRKAWGVFYEDGRETEYGWVKPENAIIYNPLYLKKPADAIWKSSHHAEEIKTGKVVSVERRTEVLILG